MIYTAKQLAAKIKAHCKTLGCAPSVWGLRHFNNPKLYARLSNGRPIMMDTYAKAVKIMERETPESWRKVKAA